MELQARFWYKRRMYEEAKSEALRAAEVYEKIGAADDLEQCRGFLKLDKLDLDSGFLGTTLLPPRIDFPFQGQETE